MSDKLFKEKLEKFYLTKRENISKASAQAYAGRILRLMKGVYPNQKMKVIGTLNKQPRKFITYINTSEDIPDSSKLGMYSAILGLVSENTNGYKSFKKNFDILKNKVRNNYLSQNKSEKELEMIMSMDTIRESINEYYKGRDTLKEKQELFNLNMFCLLPSRRAQDYSKMKVNIGPEYEGNAVHTKNNQFKRFVFNSYKNSSKKGQKIFNRLDIEELPNGGEILKFLDEGLKDAVKGSYILGKEYTPTSVTKLIKRLMMKTTGMPININILRHSYITDFMSTPRYISSRQKVANWMSHSLSVQEIYVKRNKNIKPENLKIDDDINDYDSE